MQLVFGMLSVAQAQQGSDSPWSGGGVIGKKMAFRELGRH